MMSQGGGIYFGSGIDTRQFNKDVEKMRKDILSLTKEGDKVDLSGISDQINIQKEAVKDLERQYKLVGDQLERMHPGKARQQLVREYKQIGAALEAEKQALDNLNEVYKSFDKTQESVRTQQRKVRHELYALSEAGKENTAEFHELLKELAGFDSSIDSVKALQNAMRRGNIEMQAFTGTVRAGTGVFATMTGFMGLFAEQNERVAEIQTRLQSVLSISLGVEQTYQSLLKEGSLVQSVRLLQLRAASKARELETKNTIAATAAQRAYNLVARVNPYVILTAAIISMVGALALLGRRTRETAEDQRKFNESVANSVSGTITQYQLLREQWNRLGNDLERQKKFIKDNSGAFDSLGISVENVDDAEKAFVKNTASMIQAMTSRAKAAAAQELAQEAYREYLENLDKQVKINRKLADGSLLQGIRTGWGRLVGMDEPIDEANKALERFNELIRRSADYEMSADDITRRLGLDRVEDATEKAEKRVKERTERTFRQMLEDRKKLWEDYYKAVSLIGRSAAAEVYEPDIDVDSSFVKELQKQRDELKALDAPTRKQVENLIELDEMLRSITNQESPFEKQKKHLQDILEPIGTLTDQIAFLDAQLTELGEAPDEIQFAAHIREEKDKLIAERKSMYDAFIEQHKSYADQIEDINKRTQDLLALAGTDEEVQLINEQAARQKYDAYIEMLKDKHDDINKVFTDIRALTREQLVDFLEIFQKELEEADDTARKIEISKVINRINREIERLDSTPLRNISQGFRDIQNATTDAEKSMAMDKFGRGLRDASTDFKNITRSVEEAAKSLGINLDSVFGEILNRINETANAFDMIGSGMLKAGESLLSGDILGQISGYSQIAGGIVKTFGTWFQSSVAQGRELRKITKEVQRLERAYQDLEKTLEGTISSGRYDAQLQMIQILRRQEEELIRAIEKEGKVWWRPIRFGDIKEWDAQIGEIRERIEELVSDIQTTILTVDASGMAEKLGDALVDAFQRGEDSAEALDEAINSIFRTMIRNAIVSTLMARIQPVLNDMLRTLGIDPKTGELLPGFAEVGQFTREDRERYRNVLKDIAEAGKVFFEGAGDLFDVFDELDDEISKDGLRGAIRGMSQETADILAGQFNAIRMDTSNILLIMERNQTNVDASITHLSNIDSNTALMFRELQEINDRLETADMRSSGL